ncbi:MAG: DapH/DapD/GlmU-related protein [Vampirovibrionales bacterium]
MKPLKKLVKRFFKLKIGVYRHLLSDALHVTGTPKILQATLFVGQGHITLDDTVTLGYFPSPYFYSGSTHLEARDANARIQIAENVMINNNFTAIALNASIYIGAETLIGHSVEVLTADFHHIDPTLRRDFSTPLPSADVSIGKNVWLGNSVKILKGVTIGENSIVAAGAIVVKDVPANTIVAGIPAREVQKIG